MNNLSTIITTTAPQVAAEVSNGNGVKSLILMGGLFVVFIVIFVLVSKKMKKK